MIQKIIIYLLTIIKKAKEDDIFSISAQFSYYIILGIFPFVFLFMSILGYYSSPVYELLGFIKSVIPTDIYNIILNITSVSISSYDKSYISVGIIALVWSASSGSVGIIIGINKAYGCQLKRNYIRIRIKGLLFTFSLIFALQLSFVFIIAGGNLIVFFQSISIFTEFFVLIINILRYLLPIMYFILIFSLAYKFLPYEKVSFNSVIPGAVFSTLGWILGSLLFSYYIVSRSTFYNNIYGNLSGFFIFLIWIYLSSFIFLMGAEVNALILKKHISLKRKL